MKGDIIYKIDFKCVFEIERHKTCRLMFDLDCKLRLESGNNFFSDWEKIGILIDKKV